MVVIHASQRTPMATTATDQAARSTSVLASGGGSTGERQVQRWSAIAVLGESLGADKLNVYRLGPFRAGLLLEFDPGILAEALVALTSDVAVVHEEVLRPLI